MIRFGETFHRSDFVILCLFCDALQPWPDVKSAPPASPGTFNVISPGDPKSFPIFKDFLLPGTPRFSSPTLGTKKNVVNPRVYKVGPWVYTVESADDRVLNRFRLQI
jgi:hypothetical protein